MENSIELTARQLQILSMACYTQHQIAMILGIGHSTVKNHFSEIYRRLGVDDGDIGSRCTRAVIKALRLGILRIEEISDGDRATFVRGRGRVFETSRGNYQRNLAISRLRQERPVRSIANEFDITPQRVYQICRRMREIRGAGNNDEKESHQ